MDYITASKIRSCLSLFIVFLLSFGCTQQNKGKPVDSSNSEIIQAIQQIKEIDLPTIYTCGAESYMWASEYSDIIKKITPQGCGIVGRIPTDFDCDFIVYEKVGDIVYPYLYQYNKDGNVVDSIYLHIGNCAADADIINTSKTIIDENLSIIMTDTLKYIHYYNNENYMLDSIIIREKQLCYNDQGQFEVIHDRTHRLQ